MRIYANCYIADGRCAIEPSLSPGVTRAHGTARSFNQAANRIISKCVDHSAHKGGLIYNIGMPDDATCIPASYEDALLTSHLKRWLLQSRSQGLPF